MRGLLRTTARSRELRWCLVPQRRRYVARHVPRLAVGSVRPSWRGTCDCAVGRSNAPGSASPRQVRRVNRPMEMLELADDSSAAAGVLDLRGGASATRHTAAVLEDPSGRRRVRMRWLARAAGACLCVWLAALVLAGVGLIPRGVAPLAGVLTAPDAPRDGSGSRGISTHSGPAAVSHHGAVTGRPADAAPSRAPAAPRQEPGFRGSTPGHRGTARPRRDPRAGIDRPRGDAVTSPGHRDEPAVSPRPVGSGSGQTTARGESGSASARTGSAPDQTTAPGRGGSTPGQTTQPGQAGSAPGQATAPGQAGSAPGQTTAPGQIGSTPGSEAVPHTETVPAGSGQGGRHSPVLGAGES
jgi:hypothetical protein